MIQLASPIMLWGLLGLLIPIGIHLLSRKQGKVIRIGSLRHLEETATQQFRGIRLNEIVLLILRCILLILLALYLCGVLIKPLSSSTKKWVLLEPALQENKAIQSLTDSLENNGYELRYLQQGFPSQPDSTLQTDYFTLLEELRTQSVDESVILSTNSISKFKGKQSSLPENVRWISIPETETEFTASTIALGNNQQLVRKGFSRSDLTYFENQIQPASISASTDTIRVFIQSQRQYEADKDILTAAINAASIGLHRMIVVQPYRSLQQLKANDWIFWLSDSAPPTTNNVVSMKRSPAQKLLTQQSFSHWTISRRLSAEVALQEHLTVQLANIIFDTQETANKISKYDVRSLPDSLAFSTDDRGLAAPVNPIKADSLILLLFVVFLLAERLLSYKRKQ